jgi:hypothetical protein
MISGGRMAESDETHVLRSSPGMMSHQHSALVDARGINGFEKLPIDEWDV